jgi:tetratricopeptide (TPR) repeat protein
MTLRPQGWRRFLERWRDADRWADAQHLTSREQTSAPAIAMFYAAIGAWADRSGLGSDDDPENLPEAPPDWMTLSNGMVLTALRADRKLAAGKANDSKGGIALLQEAIDDAQRRLEGVSAGPPPAEAMSTRSGGIGMSKGNGARARSSARRADAARHRITYYRTVLALLHVRLAQAIAQSGDADADKDAKKAFRTALEKQPTVMAFTAQEFARFLGARGHFAEAEQALRSIRSIKTVAAQAELARTRAFIVGDWVEGARKRGELRAVLAILERTQRELATSRAGPTGADTKQSHILLLSHAYAHYLHGQVLAELGEHRQAAQAFAASLRLYEDAGSLIDVLNLSELLGDEQVRLRAPQDAAAAYANGVRRWRAAEKAGTERERAKLLAGKEGLAKLATDAGALREYEAEFAAGAPGPLAALTDQADLPFDLPNVADRFKFFAHSRLRSPPSVARARDAAIALRDVIVRDVHTPDFPNAPSDAQTMRPWFESIRLELDPALVGAVPDLGAALIARARVARERVQAEWGVALQGIQVADSVGDRRYRILLRGVPVEEGAIPAPEAPPPTSPPVDSAPVDSAPVDSAPAEAAPAEAAQADPAPVDRAPAAPSAESPAAAPPEGTLAPAAEEVFVRLENCLARSLHILLGWIELGLMLRQHDLLPAAGTTARVETESAAAMIPLIMVARALVLQRVKLKSFPVIHARVVAGLAAHEPLEVIAAAVRAMSQVNPQLWGSEPGTVLFRIASADAARLAASIATPTSAGHVLLQEFFRRIAGLPAGACVVSPDTALRQSLGAVVALQQHAMLSDDEVPTGRLATAQPLPLVIPAQDDAAAPALGSAPPPGPAHRLRRLIEQEALRRGLDGKTRRAIFRSSVRCRDGDWFYAAELALDGHAPEAVELRCGTATLGALEPWAAAGGPDELRLMFYRETGVYLPPIRLRLDDGLPPGQEKLVLAQREDKLELAGDHDAMIGALMRALVDCLAVFLANRDLERLLTRLNTDQPLLVTNAIERLGIPLILRELRELISINRSIRNLPLILDTLLMTHGRPDAERRLALQLCARDFING